MKWFKPSGDDAFMQKEKFWVSCLVLFLKKKFKKAQNIMTNMTQQWTSSYWVTTVDVKGHHKHTDF